MLRLTSLLFFLLPSLGASQSFAEKADSIRNAHHIPELAFAVVSADSIYQSYICGTPVWGSGRQAKRSDCFHLGSNTKAITAFIAADLVKKGQLKWDTRFFDLFPELESSSRKVYRNITLEMLLTFRGKVPPYTYFLDLPDPKLIKGKFPLQRLLVAQYFLQQPPMKKEKGLTRSNVDYILAGLMLEKASGKSYETLLNELGERLNIHFGLNPPVLSDALQVQGHDAQNRPADVQDVTKLNWLLCAGNIHMNLPDYQVFIQEELKALHGTSSFFTQTEMQHMLFGFRTFSMGWFNFEEGKNHLAHNAGNAASFRSDVRILKEKNCAIIVLMNASSDTAMMGMNELIEQLVQQYSN